MTNCYYITNKSIKTTIILQHKYRRLLLSYNAKPVHCYYPTIKIQYAATQSVCISIMLKQTARKRYRHPISQNQ